MPSAEFNAARLRTDVQMAGGIKLLFPAFDALPALTKQFGTTNFELDADGYRHGLKDMPSTRQQRGVGQDTLDFAITDPESAVYDELRAYEDVIEDTQVTFRECLITSNDIYEAEIVLDGFLDSMEYTESEQSLRFTGISDMSRLGFLLGGRILTQRYCSAVFNVNGLLSPLVSICGWQTGQGGNPVFCTHKLKGTDGCQDHNNSHRMYAVEGLATANVTYTSGGGFGGGGWDYGGGPCFIPETPVWMADGSARPIWMVNRGDLVWSFDTHGNLVKKQVIDVHKHLVNFVLPMDFGRGRLLTPTPNHLLAIQWDTFRMAEGFDPGDTVKAHSGNRWRNLPLFATPQGLLEKRTRVHNLSIADTKTYMVGAGDTWVGVSNVKPITPYDPYGTYLEG